ncbi:MAG: hypothetical protein M5U34_35140 [Chloroflexi bacterium]|nr:hypothetical protein [Chloroflexota bacterium]
MNAVATVLLVLPATRGSPCMLNVVRAVDREFWIEKGMGTIARLCPDASGRGGRGTPADVARDSDFARHLGPLGLLIYTIFVWRFRAGLGG